MWLIFTLFLVSGIQMAIVYFGELRFFFPPTGSAGWPLYWSVYRVSSRLTQKAINYTWRSCFFLGLNPLNHPLSWLACWYWACLSNITRWVLKVGLLQTCFPRCRPAILRRLSCSAWKMSLHIAFWKSLILARLFSRGNPDSGTWLRRFLACWEIYLLQLASFDSIQFLQSFSHICTHMDDAKHGHKYFLIAALHVKGSLFSLRVCTIF